MRHFLRKEIFSKRNAHFAFWFHKKKMCFRETMNEIETTAILSRYSPIISKHHAEYKTRKHSRRYTNRCIRVGPKERQIISVHTPTTKASKYETIPPQRRRCRVGQCRWKRIQRRRSSYITSIASHTYTQGMLVSQRARLDNTSVVSHTYTQRMVDSQRGRVDITPVVSHTYKQWMIDSQRARLDMMPVVSHTYAQYDSQRAR